jgi:hypothetical protein
MRKGKGRVLAYYYESTPLDVDRLLLLDPKPSTTQLLCMSGRPIYDYHQPGVSSTHAYHSYERWNPAQGGPMPSASDGRHAAAAAAATSSQKQSKSQSQEQQSAAMHYRSSSSRPEQSSSSYHYHNPTTTSSNNPQLERGRRTEGRSGHSSAPRPSATPLVSSSSAAAHPSHATAAAAAATTTHSSRSVNKHEERATGHKRTATEPLIYDGTYGTSRRAASASRAADTSYMAPPISVRTDQQAAAQPSSSSRARSTDAERQRDEERARRHEKREERERQKQRQRDMQGMTVLEQDRDNERQREIEKAKERESRRARERSTRTNEMEIAAERSRHAEGRDIVNNSHSTRHREPTDERVRSAEPARTADMDRTTHRSRAREGYADQQPPAKPIKAFRDYGDLAAQDPDSSDSARRHPVPSSSRHHRRHTDEALISAAVSTIAISVTSNLDRSIFQGSSLR